MMSKDTLRQMLRDQRGMLSPEERLSLAKALEELFIRSHLVPQGVSVAGYHAMESELDPAGILESLFQEGHRCALPVTCFGSRILQFREFIPHQVLQKDIRGIPAPMTGIELIPDIILIPMLGFDSKGYRLGQGGGHYDSTLDALRPLYQVTAIGLAFDCQEVDALPIEIHDQPMDYIVTPTRILSFR